MKAPASAVRVATAITTRTQGANADCNPAEAVSNTARVSLRPLRNSARPSKPRQRGSTPRGRAMCRHAGSPSGDGSRLAVTRRHQLGALTRSHIMRTWRNSKPTTSSALRPKGFRGQASASAPMLVLVALGDMEHAGGDAVSGNATRAEARDRALEAQRLPAGRLPLPILRKQVPSRAVSYGHVVPRRAGGRTDWTNTVTACKPCNTRKANHRCDELACGPCAAPCARSRCPFNRR